MTFKRRTFYIITAIIPTLALLYSQLFVQQVALNSTTGRNKQFQSSCFSFQVTRPAIFWPTGH